MSDVTSDYEEFIYNLPLYHKLNISNYKLRFRIEVSSLNDYNELLSYILDNTLAIKKYSNFCTIPGLYKYILYCSGHINVSGITMDSADRIKAICEDIERLTRRKPIKLNNDQFYQIDNITATSHPWDNKVTINFNIFTYISKVKDIKSFLTGCDYLTKIGIYYEPECFHAIKVISDIGTAMIFSNSVINYVGSKSKNELCWMHS